MRMRLLPVLSSLSTLTSPPIPPCLTLAQARPTACGLDKGEKDATALVFRTAQEREDDEKVRRRTPRPWCLEPRKRGKTTRRYEEQAEKGRNRVSVGWTIEGVMHVC